MSLDTPVVYIFYGDKDVGKTSIAIALRQAFLRGLFVGNVKDIKVQSHPILEIVEEVKGGNIVILHDIDEEEVILKIAQELRELEVRVVERVYLPDYCTASSTSRGYPNTEELQKCIAILEYLSFAGYKDAIQTEGEFDTAAEGIFDRDEKGRTFFYYFYIEAHYFKGYDYTGTYQEIFYPAEWCYIKIIVTKTFEKTVDVEAIAYPNYPYIREIIATSFPHKIQDWCYQNERFICDVSENIVQIDSTGVGTYYRVSGEEIRQMDYTFDDFYNMKVKKHDTFSVPHSTRVYQVNAIFVCDMGDLFGKWNSIPSIIKVLKVEERIVLWRYLHLTKNPQRYLDISKHYVFAPYQWIGVTVNKACEANRIELLKQRGAYAHKFVSFEPLYEEIPCDLTDIDWIIIGSQTRPTLHPDYAWVAALVNQAERLKIPVFIKDNLRVVVPFSNQEIPYWRV